MRWSRGQRFAAAGGGGQAGSAAPGGEMLPVGGIGFAGIGRAGGCNVSARTVDKVLEFLSGPIDGRLSIPRIHQDDRQRSAGEADETPYAGEVPADGYSVSRRIGAVAGHCSGRQRGWPRWMDGWRRLDCLFPPPANVVPVEGARSDRGAYPRRISKKAKGGKTTTNDAVLQVLSGGGAYVVFCSHPMI